VPWQESFNKRLGKTRVGPDKELVDERGAMLKRTVAAALTVAIGVPLAAQGATANSLRTAKVVTSSKGWVVTLSIPRTTLRSGSSMDATITVDNRTGYAVKFVGCVGDQVFAVGLGNAKVPYPGIASSVACWSTLHRGANVFHEHVWATYQVCGGSTNLPCPAGGGMPGLPGGRYHTVVRVPHVTPTMPNMGVLWVTITK
jgi:hypothetical protein